MTKDEVAWAIAKSAFHEDMQRVQDNIDQFAERLLGEGKAHLNEAARNYAPDVLTMIRENKIERQIKRAEQRREYNITDDTPLHLLWKSPAEFIAAIDALPPEQAITLARLRVMDDYSIVLDEGFGKWCAKHAKTIVEAGKAWKK